MSPNAGGGGGGGSCVGLSQWVQLCTWSPNKFWRSYSILWMRFSRVVRASDSQYRSRNCPGFDPSMLRHSEIWGAADEIVLNTVHKKNPPYKKIFTLWLGHTPILQVVVVQYWEILEEQKRKDKGWPQEINGYCNASCLWKRNEWRRPYCFLLSLQLAQSPSQWQQAQS